MGRDKQKRPKLLIIIPFLIVICLILISCHVSLTKAEVCGNSPDKEKFNIYGYTEIIEIDKNQNGMIWVIVPLKFEDLNFSFDYEFEFYLNVAFLGINPRLLRRFSIFQK